MAVKANDKVGAGQVVAELNVGNLELQIEQRKLLLEKARISHEMLEVTRANKYQITLAAIDVRLAELELESLQRSYANLRLVAPFAGTVVWVNAEEGEYVEAFKPIIRVIDPAELVLECSADTQSAAAFVRGASVSVSVNGKDCRGTVIMTPLDAMEQTRVRDGQPGVLPALETPAALRKAEKDYVLIKVHDLPRDAVLNDLGIATLVIARRERAIALPKDVVNTYSGRTYVNILRDGEVEERDVEVGIQIGSEIEIVKGLSGGERVVRR
jgi:macrolide-specific efflux system membrane fusion protein